MYERESGKSGGASQQGEGAAGQSGREKLKRGLAGASYDEQVARLTPAKSPAAKSAAFKPLKTLADYPGLVELLAGRGAGKGAQPAAPANETGPAAPAPNAASDPDAAEVTGLATATNLASFIAAAKEVERNWATTTPAERAEGFGDAAADELAAVGVPETGTLVSDLGSRSGQLDFQSWNLELNETEYQDAAAQPAQIATAADVVYHEARHAEQWHRMARVEAGRGKTADQLVSEMAIPQFVADDAAADPLGGDSTAAKEGAAWFESIYGAQRDYRGTVLTNLGSDCETFNVKLAELQAAQQDLSDLEATGTATEEQLAAARNLVTEATLAYETAQAALDVTYQQYRALPEEADAWAVGGAVSSNYSK